MAVCLIATGGTIASLKDPRTGAVRPTVEANRLATSVPGLEEAGLTRVEEVASVSGWNMTPELALRVTVRANELLTDESIDGVVVTHGTDTVEETAFVCDLLVASDKPVVFAGAMRSGDEISADGPGNLLAATRVAGAADARGLGAVVVMNDEVHAARWVRKLDSFRVNSMASADHGPVALVTAGGLRVLHRPQRVTLAAPTALSHAVPVLQTYTGIEPRVINAVVDATNASGVVLEGTGLGNIPGSAAGAISALIERGLPVVVATRTAHGGTGAIYGGAGGGATLRDMGVISAASLTAAKARLLLMILLARGRPSSEVSARFATIAEQLR